MSEKAIDRRSGFVAGTLVHTIDGLKPIEQIQVGDLVLSKSEHGFGDVAYKKVTRSYKSDEKKAIYHIRYAFWPTDTHSLQDLRFNKFVKWSLFCSGEHPFWSVEYISRDSGDFVGQEKWVEASNFSSEHILIDKNGRHYITECMASDDKWRYELKPLYATKGEKVAIGAYDSEIGMDYLVDFSQNKPIIINGAVGGFDDNTEQRYGPQEVLSVTQDGGGAYQYYNNLARNLKNGFEDFYYYDDVYNIGVEDYRTYFVGHVGVWVHQ